MSRAKNSWWVGVVMALAASVAAAASLPVSDGDKAQAVPSAAALAKFYPTPLSTSPVGVVEDQEVWLAKVQGLIAGAPAWLQQNVLSSQTKAEFSANLALLQQIQKGSLEEGAVVVKGLAKSGKLGTKGLVNPNPDVLGSGNGSLVYTALEPCRIMDSRFAAFASGVQGPLVGNHLYSLPGEIGTNWGLYGGSGASDCGINTSLGINVWGIALVITILNPNFDAYLGVSDVNNLSTVLSNVALNYTHGQGLSTQYIVPQTSSAQTIYFAMPMSLSANIIFDVVGYFATSEATALDCTTVTSAAYPLAANAFGSGAAPACPAGFTSVFTSCFPSDFFDTLVGTNGNTCYVRSELASPTSFVSSQTCCRVPGR